MSYTCPFHDEMYLQESEFKLIACYKQQCLPFSFIYSKKHWALDCRHHTLLGIEEGEGMVLDLYHLEAIWGYKTDMHALAKESVWVNGQIV